MNAFYVAPIAFTCLVAATCGGMVLSRRLPTGHLASEAKDVIKLATAVVGTLAALALGLLIASAKSEFESVNAELKTSAARIVLLDRVLAEYGSETADARARLKNLVEERIVGAWTVPSAADENQNDNATFEGVQETIRNLVPSSPPRQLLQARALQISGQIAEGYWLTTEAAGGGLPWPFVAVLVFWLSLLFGTFGLLAPVNVTVTVTLLTCAASVAAAIYLIVDMDHPYIGFIHVSDAPLQAALAALGRP